MSTQDPDELRRTVDLDAPRPRARVVEGAPPHLSGTDLRSRLGRAEAADRFEIRRVAGVGASGQVYIAADRSLDREVAIKVLGEDHDADEDIDNFIDEARITATLTHPNVLPVHDIDVTDQGRPYFSMKKIEGSSLGAGIERAVKGDRPEQLAEANGIVNVFIAVCQALAFAHHKGVIHQDVKPDNIMLGAYGEVLLVDWGSATRIGDSRRRLYGTPLYMSPEQARLEGSTTSSDVYCVGASLFHALFLRPPTWHDQSEPFWIKKRAGEIDLPTAEERRAVPAAILRIALKALAATPNNRYLSVEELLGDLRAFQAGRRVSVYRDPPLKMLLRWYRANPRAFLATAAALVAALLAFGEMWRERERERALWVEVAAEDFTGTPAAIDLRWSRLAKKADGPMPFAQIPNDDPRVAVVDGAVRLTSTTDYVDLVWREPVAGDFRVEWEYMSVREGRDLNCFIGENREAGFTFHVGGGRSTTVLLTHGGYDNLLAEGAMRHPIALGRYYQFTLERNHQHLRLIMDGRTLIDYPVLASDEMPLATRFGLDTYAGGSCVAARNLHLLIQPLAQRISPLAVGNKLMQVGKLGDARAQFLEIAKAYPGTDLEGGARYQAAVCALRLGDTQAGVAELKEFERQFPDDETIPLSLHARSVAAADQGDEAEASRLREDLARFKGHPILRSTMVDYARRHLQVLVPKPLMDFTSRTFPDDIVERISVVQRELHRLSDAYGVSLRLNPFITACIPVLRMLGRSDLIYEWYRYDDFFSASALYAMGRFQEVIDKHPYVQSVVHAVIKESGRAELRPRLDPVQLVETLIAKKDCDRLIKEFPADIRLPDTLIDCGRVEDLLKMYPNPHDGDRSPQQLAPRYRALKAMKRWQELLEEYPDQPGDALIALGRYRQLLSRRPLDPADLHRVAMCLIRDGDEVAGTDLVKHLAQIPPDHTDDMTMFSHYLLPVMMPVLFGRTVDATNGLRPVIDHQRYVYGQRLWYLASYIAGDIDEKGFLAQPYSVIASQMLPFARALKHDCRGETEEALADYRSCLDLNRDDVIMLFIEARIRERE